MNRAARRVRAARQITTTLTVTRSGRRIGDAAAESAFFIALAILPMMLTTTAVLRAVRPLLGAQADSGVNRGLARLLRIVLTPRGRTASEAADQLLGGASGGLLTVGSMVALILVTRAMRSLLTGLAEVSRAGEGRQRRGVREWGTAGVLALVAVGLTAAILAMIVVGPLLGHSRDIATGVDRVVRATWTIVRWPVAISLVFLFLMLIHTIGLRAHVGGTRTRRAALAGAGVTSAGAVGATALLPLYVHVAGSVSQTIGALGGGLILMIWSYLLAFALLFGAHVRVLLISRTTQGQHLGDARTRVS